MNEELQKEGITDLFLCGLATDVCVGDIWIKIENISSKILSFSGKLYFIVFRQELINSNNIQVGIDNLIQYPGWSAFHALESGYRTVIVEDASRGIFSQVSLPSMTNVTICH